MPVSSGTVVAYAFLLISSVWNLFLLGNALRRLCPSGKPRVSLPALPPLSRRLPLLRMDLHVLPLWLRTLLARPSILCLSRPAACSDGAMHLPSLSRVSPTLPLCRHAVTDRFFFVLQPMTIHDWLLACDDRFARDWSVWVCTTGNCFRLSPLICIFCYTPLTPRDQLHRRCPLTYPRNHMHRLPGGGIHRSIRAWWLLTRDVLLYSHRCDSTPSFFFCRPALI